MAFYGRTDNIPRDPRAIDTRGEGAGTLVAGLIVLVVAALVLGFFLFGSGTTTPERTVNAPSTTQISPPANTPAPAPQRNPATP
jgi:hypothetical protein